MLIIPAIDIIGGKCVRLTKGDYSQKKIYNEDPLEVALWLEDAGLTHLHLVDLDGAKEKKVVNWKVLERIAAKTSLHIDFGGGIRSDADLDIAFNSGAEKVTAGSVAVTAKTMVLDWLKKFGAEKIILGADCRKKMIAINGWEKSAGVHLFDLLDEYREAGIQYVICTDIDRDGVMQGPALDLYKETLDRQPEISLIASGGVSTIKDVEELAEAGLFGAIIGKAIYEGAIKLEDLKRFLK